MFIKQLSVFVQNIPGRLKKVVDLLAENNIDIRALSVSDTSTFGIMRMIVAEPDKAAALLKENDCAVLLTDVLAVEISDTPGGLSAVVDALADGSVNIEYLYAFLSRRSNAAFVILRLENNDRAVEALRSKGIEPATAADIYAM